MVKKDKDAANDDDQVTEDQVHKDKATECTVDETVETEEQAEPEIPFEDLTAEQQVAILQQKLADSSNDVLRAIADLQNMRKRTDEEIAKERKYGCSTLARDLFGVADNLRMAMASISDTDKKYIPALNNLSFGLDMVLKEFLNAFERNGITQILPTVGDDFDHNMHQAMGETETPDIEAGKIAFVMSAGYTLHDRLLKPAMVNVAKAITTDGATDTESDTISKSKI